MTKGRDMERQMEPISQMFTQGGVQASDWFSDRLWGTWGHWGITMGGEIGRSSWGGTCGDTVGTEDGWSPSARCLPRAASGSPTGWEGH